MKPLKKTLELYARNYTQSMKLEALDVEANMKILIDVEQCNFFPEFFKSFRPFVEYLVESSLLSYN